MTTTGHPDHANSGPENSGHTDTGHAGSGHEDSRCLVLERAGPGHEDSEHENSERARSGHADSGHAGSDHAGSDHAGSAREGFGGVHPGDGVGTSDRVEGAGVTLREASAGDAEPIADAFLAARAEMTYLPRLHTDEETRWWIANLVLPSYEVWVACAGARVLGFAAVREGWLEHLYLAPTAQGAGIGTALLERARQGMAALDLHVFQANGGAIRFYERHGFTLVATGNENEEGLPDAHYRWTA